MIQLLKPLTVLTLMAFFDLAFAVSVYECEDPEGNRTFEDHCPPGTAPVGEKKYSTGSSKESSKADISAVLYVVPECDSCEEVREFLTMRGISFTEKNVDGNPELQTELKEKAGELKVPVTLIGETIITGYNRQKLTAAIEGTGVSSPQTEKPAAEEKPVPEEKKEELSAQ
ncbi:MAG: glutaredoxin [Gammaproteobacteria bacterium]|nr:glutaredoxin [Gammaproteobacteria bacterium]